MIRKAEEFCLSEDVVPFTSRTPTYLTPEQRHALIQIPADLSDREIARHYTFSRDDLDLINQRRRHQNRLGFAVQLAVLSFPDGPGRISLASQLVFFWRSPIKCRFQRLLLLFMDSVITPCMSS